ncbi:hypothetical protein [Corallococcus macrosporus]|uniref:Uncharacterized protein n=2 Tax=Myxococcaceae TaxID=31 RepID=A0A250JVE3_9BACT|nr:hypothetical protein [Corallococcus macrosporus]AEI66422.1 hypothetical protein LILAB_22635 [Corallococcus macrosporus]ATB47321.1 hypothetical protein MYMAC_002929 [Corallococcus macrosporus DSM 14697]
MATEPKKPASDQDESERKAEEAAGHPRRLDKEAREDGMPGYGQPDEDVREQSLPEQGW